MTLFVAGCIVCYDQVNSLKKFSFSFYLFLREIESMSRGEAERKGDRESEAGSVLSAQSWTWGLNPWTMRS